MANYYANKPVASILWYNKSVRGIVNNLTSSINSMAALNSACNNLNKLVNRLR